MYLLSKHLNLIFSFNQTFLTESFMKFLHQNRLTSKSSFIFLEVQEGAVVSQQAIFQGRSGVVLLETRPNIDIITLLTRLFQVMSVEKIPESRSEGLNVFRRADAQRR